MLLYNCTDNDQGKAEATTMWMLHVELGYTDLMCGHSGSKPILLAVHELVVLCALKHIISGTSRQPYLAGLMWFLPTMKSVVS